jgi:hypothetical protein
LRERPLLLGPWSNKPDLIGWCDKTTSEWGVHQPGSAWAILSEARTQSTHNKHTIPYIKFKYDYYTLGLCIKYIKGSLKQKHASRKCFRVSESDLSLVQYIPFALEVSDIHQRSKPTDPSMAPNPHRFGPSTGIPRRHCRKEEEDPHLHTEDNKSKAWATMLNKIDPSWSNNHE